MKHWTRFWSFDGGAANPFFLVWWTIFTDDYQHPDGQTIPKGAMVRYREWYGAKKDENGLTVPNTGLKMTAEEIAKGIKAREKNDPDATPGGDKVNYGVADPAIFPRDGGPSHAERMGALGVFFRHADNSRVGDKGHLGGWDMMRQRLIGNEGVPMIYTFNTCLDSIRTIPALQHDDSRPEDVDTDGEDHAGDEWRYACMSRPWMRDAPVNPLPIDDMGSVTLNRLFKEAKKRR